MLSHKLNSYAYFVTLMQHCCFKNKSDAFTTCNEPRVLSIQTIVYGKSARVLGTLTLTADNSAFMIMEWAHGGCDGSTWDAYSS
jgi:hypothetical protein